MEHQNTPQPANARACEIYSPSTEKWVVFSLDVAAIALEAGLKVRYLVLHEEQAADHVLVPVSVLEAAESSLATFIGDQGWGDEDMQNMDNLSAYIAQHKAATIPTPQLEAAQALIDQQAAQALSKEGGAA